MARLEAVLLMAEWGIPNEMIQRAAKGLMECHGDTDEEWGDFELDAIVALEAAFEKCGTCSGDGDIGFTSSGPDKGLHICPACNGTCLAGTEWRCHYREMAEECLHDTEPTLDGHSECHLILVIPFERSE